MENLKQASGEIEAQVRPPPPPPPLQFFSSPLFCSVSLQVMFFFFQNSRFTEIIRHYILKQTL